MAAPNNLNTLVNVCEDTDKSFSILDLLIAAGYTPPGPVVISSIQVKNPDGTFSEAPTSLVSISADGSSMIITASNEQDWYGYLETLSLVVESGNELFTVKVGVTVDPVNDAPEGADQAITLTDAAGYVLKEADFGFRDVVEGNGFKSVVISSVPGAGQLLLNGVVLQAGAEVSITDIRAGALVYQPPAGGTGLINFGFQVRDDGGIVGCNASDLDATANLITFQLPLLGRIGDQVWIDTDRDGVQDGGEGGVAGVTVTLTGAGTDGVFGTGDDITRTTTTNATGNYLFDGLAAGQYQVAFGGLAGHQFTSPNVGSDAQDSDANANGLSQVITLAAGETNLTVDAGLVTQVPVDTNTAQLGDRVWYDTDRDGVQDGTETGAAGVAVTLAGAGADGVFGTGDDISRTTTTNASGNYLFTGLAAGNYQVTFGNVAGYGLTTANVGSDATDSDAIIGTGKSQVVALAIGETNLTVDAGLVQIDTNTARLGDRVWYDTDRDGVQDSTETGAAGVTVTLAGAGADGVFGTGDDISRTTTTDAAGNYLFTGLAAGQYQVAFGGKTGYQLTTANVGNDATDSDATIGTGKSQIVSLAIGETNLTIDAGLVQTDYSTAQLGDRVWYDTDRDGVQDADETGVAGVTVTLAGAGFDGVFGTGDDFSRTTTTNATGNYLFAGLAAGNYQVTFGGKTGYALTTANVGSDATDSDAIVGTGKSQVVALAIGETNLTVDAGLVRLETNTASLGDRVWIDANGNGVQDTGEASVAGVTVRLLNASGQVIATQLTDANGNYLFTGLAAGQYAVQVVAPSGYKFTTANAGTNDATDSDTVWDGTGTQTGTTGLVTLQIGESNRTVDAGVKVCLVKIGDKVWLDADADGVQDAGEAGVAGVTMTLTGTGADGVFGTQDDTLRTTTTDASGNYLFSDVAWGQYKVGMTMPNGLALTTANVGSNDAVDSDFVATTTAGANLIVNGSFESGTTGWTGLGDTVEVVQASWSWFAVTGATGTYVAELDANAAGSGTGIYQDIQTETNRVYQLSLDVAARSGTALSTNTVEVWWGNNRVATIDPTSTTFKTYTFNVVGSGGAVRLSFREQTGDDDCVGGIIDNVRLTSPSTTHTSAVTVASCDDNLTVDAGVVDTKTGKLGDRVWIDSDRDGVQDSNEVGVSGVAVTLAGAGTDGVFGTGDDISRSTTTDSNGNYLFTGLAAGQYQVTFGGKTGYQFTTANVGNDATDSDANANTGKSQVVTLGYGETNLTVDAGLRDSLTGAIGDRVWHDDPANASGSYSAGYANGIQDTSEPYGLAGVRVYLYKSDTSSGGGTLVGSMVTDSSGYYRFNNLAAGWYQVEFDKGGLRNTSSPTSPNQSLDTWVWTAKDQGPNDQKDSDVTAGNIAKVRTDVFYLSEGQVDLSRDAGLTPIVIDLDGDGIHTIARGASDATFDLFGNGSPIKSGWLSAKDGFLAVDRDGNGKVDDIHELFGGTAKGEGFAKLASFDSNGDGVVDAQDADFAKLLVWQDVNSDHQSDAGELMTLAQAGVASLTVAYIDQPYLDAQGNLHLERSSAGMSDGSSVDMTDVYFNVDAADAVAAGLVLPSMSELLGVDNALLDQGLGDGAAREQAAIADVGFDAGSEAQRAIAAAMQQADAHLALAV